MNHEINDKIIRLLQLYLIGEIRQEEQQELDSWLEKSEENRLFFQQIREENTLAREHDLFESTDRERALRLFKQRLSLAERKQRTLKPTWWKYVAILLLPLTVTGILLWQYQTHTTPLAQPIKTIQPGRSQAILVLDNGKQISLATNNKKEIQVTQVAKASQRQDQLIYTSPKTTRKEIQYNELRIPRGGEYKVTLSDGTQIHLNSATRLKYPVTFHSKERKVYLEGEAYFEVTKDPDHPFLVEVNGSEVKVYGTSFNINSYKENEVQTVLVEGSVGVRVLASGNEKRIEPGEMAVFNKTQEDIEVKKVNVALYTEWRHGELRFENERLEDILSTLSKWYDVDIFYQTPETKDFHFTGHLGRYKDINTILNSITLATDVQFNIRGKTIIVSK